MNVPPELVDIDDLAVLAEAATIMARLRDHSAEPVLVAEAADLGHAAIQILLDYVLLHPDSVSVEGPN